MDSPENEERKISINEPNASPCIGRPRLSPERLKVPFSTKLKPAVLRAVDQAVEDFPERFNSRSEFIEEAIVHYASSLRRRRKQ